MTVSAIDSGSQQLWALQQQHHQRVQPSLSNTAQLLGISTSSCRAICSPGRH